jgi:hypothetical protein
LIDRQNFARFVAPRRIADPGGAAAHERDRLPAGLLQPIEHHDRDQMTHMQGWGRTVVPDIGDELSLRGKRIEALGIRYLMHKAPFAENVEKVGLEFRHDCIS